ncbi:TonB-dependent receptor [Dyella jiangningensis]|nr:TonB-dependent receptor [Dyella jiangningensis]
MKAGCNKNTRRNWGISRHPLYAGLFAALAGLTVDLPAQAQQAHSESAAPQQFSIAAGELGDALNQLATQSRLQIMYAPELVRGKAAPRVSGELTWRQALEKLLTGSGLEWSLVGHNLVAIRKAPESPQPSRGERGASTQGPAQAAAPAAVTLKKVTVLGSLIPRSQIETASPLIVISANDIKNRGFSSVADALQNLTLNTGSINNTAINAGDVWAAKTVSLFGLDPSFTKFLIDGRPMPVFSQVAQNQVTDQLNTNLSGIPIDLVERIEILPGGQSSLYGSDAIAGVINIVLKKHVRFGTVDAREGWYSDGGGRERMLSASDSFQIGKLNLMVGGQVSDQQPMWDFQRRITAQNFAGGSSPQQPGVDGSVYGFSGNSYFPAQAGDCSKLTGLWGGSERYYASPYGAVCGSVRDGAYGTLINKDRTASLSVHADYAVNDSVQLYADLLDSYEEQSHETVGDFFGLINDANLHDDVVIFRAFAPEERAHSLDGLLSQKSYENTYTATVGGKVDFGKGWNLDVGLTSSYERDDDRQSGLLNTSVPGSYGSALLGPQLGADSFGFPMYAPNYSLLTRPLTPEEYASYTGAASIESNNRTDQLRAQLTQASLFGLPGGDAGLALVAEEGYESWKYQPSPLLEGGGNAYLQGLSWNPSNGHRNRYATAAELNLPVFKMLTADLSARYDSYDAEGAHFSHPTWNAGLEFRPFQELLLRGRYSTSFKAPSLIDEFEGGSTYQDFVVDRVNCARLGFTGPTLSSCPGQYQDEPLTVTQTSNPHLQPMTSKNLSYGVVWSPVPNLSMNVDYQHLSIRNEVVLESPGSLLQFQWYCMQGALDPSSPTCRAANAQITRVPVPSGSPLLGRITGLLVTKANVAHEVNNSIIAGASYRFEAGAYGQFGAHVAYTRVLSHRQQQFPGDPVLDYLNAPAYSTEFKTKANAELNWSRGKWNATLFGTYFGPTPNYVARITNGYDAPYAAKLAAWRIYNASVSYAPTASWQLSLRINNIKNSMPPVDLTYPGTSNQPFNPANYNPYGREIFLEARYRFGHGGSD